MLATPHSAIGVRTLSRRGEGEYDLAVPCASQQAPRTGGACRSLVTYALMCMFMVLLSHARAYEGGSGQGCMNCEASCKYHLNATEPSQKGRNCYRMDLAYASK